MIGARSLVDPEAEAIPTRSTRNRPKFTHTRMKQLKKYATFITESLFLTDNHELAREDAHGKFNELYLKN